MRSHQFSIPLALAAVFFMVILGQAQPVASQAVSVMVLKSVPDGNYLLTLELNGKVQRLNLAVQDNRAKCVTSTDPALKSVQGQFELKGNGVFLALLRGGNFRASQLWIFRKDGAAAVREIPDRGELQSAAPVKGESLEIPKGQAAGENR